MGGRYDCVVQARVGQRRGRGVGLSPFDRRAMPFLRELYQVVSLPFAVLSCCTTHASTRSTG
jgi:hypothetical protein